MVYFISINQVFMQIFQKSIALCQLMDFILRGMDKGFHTGMILIDLQKSFDTIDHTILLQKMECMGFKESVMFSIISLTQKIICDTRRCLF